MSRINDNGINIKEVSDHVKMWYKYMPQDITQEDVNNFKSQHQQAVGDDDLMGGIISKDVTYPGCYIASRLRESGKMSDEEIDSLLFDLGKQAFMDQKGHWKRCMQTFQKIK